MTPCRCYGDFNPCEDLGEALALLRRARRTVLMRRTPAGEAAGFGPVYDLTDAVDRLLAKYGGK